MRVVCAWCGDIIKSEGNGESHGLCHGCFGGMMAEDFPVHAAELGLRDVRSDQRVTHRVRSAKAVDIEQPLIRED